MICPLLLRARKTAKTYRPSQLYFWPGSEALPLAAELARLKLPIKYLRIFSLLQYGGVFVQKP